MNEEPVDGHAVAAARTDALASARPERGQSLVEFSLVLIPLLLIMLGIIQFGLIFNAQVTITNAAREGARAATVYRFDQGHTKAWNDAARNDAAATAVVASLGILSKVAPQFASGDVTVAYSVPASVQDSDGRAGEQIKVSVTYHQDLVVPLIANLLPRDSNGRLAQGATVTMVIN
ncbi:MAG TPA: TadE family protein [Candidatus Limnocylindrales bacterium]|nr:TadE family protein [Candidatus Limnocylindrales bacterium]